MKLEPGMRVRCVEDESHVELERGCEYVINRTYVASIDRKFRVQVEGSRNSYFPERFKPIIRVKAGSLRV